MATEATKDTQVLIIGAGVVGLSASLFLEQHNIKSIVLERRAGTSIHPRARSINQRTAELFRHLGIEDQVHEAAKGIADSSGIYTGSSLKEVMDPKPRRKVPGKKPLAGLSEQVSPARGTFVTQDLLEPLLNETARKRGRDIRFNQEFQSLTQDDDGVTVTFKDRTTSDIHRLTACYVIAADGAKSPACAQLGVQKIGRGAMAHMINILFRADLASFVKDREFSIVKILRPEVKGIFTSINNSDRWVFHLVYDPSKGEKASDFTKERCADLVRIASGMPDLDIQVESTLPWEPSVNVAKQLQHGRVFLAGDAAHQMPPWAGQGANSGFSDVHNLSWKLAAVLNGIAKPNLLETYNVERQPVGAYAAEASATGTDELGMISVNLWQSEVRRGFWMKLPLYAGFGYAYKSRAILEERNWPLGGLTWAPWSAPALLLALDGRPGRRAPHVWAERAGERISTVDVLGKEFVILAGEDGGAEWRRAASSITEGTGTQISVYTIGPSGDLTTKAGEFLSAAGITSRGALLVRPDDFVAARWRRGPTNAFAELDKAMRQILYL